MFESLSMFGLPVMGIVGMSTGALLGWLATAYFGAKGVGDFYTNQTGQSRQRESGKEQLDFLKQQLAAKTEGGRQLLAHNTAETDKMMARLTKEKSGERAERRLERADALESQNKQYELAMIAQLMQAMSNQGQQNINARAQVQEPRPMSMMNLMRGGGF